MDVVPVHVVVIDRMDDHTLQAEQRNVPLHLDVEASYLEVKYSPIVVDREEVYTLDHLKDHLV